MKVFVERFAKEYERMFSDRGHTVVETIEEADVIQFIGGADVTPQLYGEQSHPRTGHDPQADLHSELLYKKAIMLQKPCIGICRGAQYLNVVNGGKMYQDVDGHAKYGTHIMYEDWTKREIAVSSTHHQMMRPAEEGQVICWADEATYKENVGEDGEVVRYTGDDRDVEVVFYEEAQDLCFQPHPEMMDRNHECQEYYFELLERLLGLT